jgi:DNA-binding transcriptional LysR family regulator
VRLDTFKAAAHRLNLTVSAVSHRIRAWSMLVAMASDSATYL